MLQIVWEHDRHSSVYAMDWLISWAECPGHPDPSQVPRRLWRREHEAALGRFRFEDLYERPEALREYLRTLLCDGIGLVENVPDTDDGVKQVAELAGHVRASFSGYFFDVKAYPKPVGTAYSANALEPHTDVPCEEYPPGIQYLHCRRNDAVGGQTTFVDGAAVASDLRITDPEAFELLSTLSVPFRFSHDGLDMRARQTVIVCDRSGAVTGVNISQHMADVFDLDQRALDRYCPAFHRFLGMLRDPEYAFGLDLRPGQCIVFDNQRIVHGRTAYDPTSGARILRGCYTDRGELRSRYRVTTRGTAEKSKGPAPMITGSEP